MLRTSLAASALAALALVVAQPASAQTASDKVYVELRGGAAFLADSDIEDLGGFDDIELETKTGWVIEGAVGYAHNSGLRGEVALGYRENDFDEISADFGGSSFSGDIDGDISAFTVLANGYYDFYLSKYGAQGGLANLTPFVGGGLGVAVLDTDGDLGDENETTFAYQAIVGLSYAFTDTVGLSLRYAFLSAPAAEFENTDVDYDSHAVMAGLRFSF